MNTYRPRVSRETRLLLTAAICAVVALWILARLRFPDRPPTPNPVAPFISQLALPPKFEDLAGEISTLQARLGFALLVLNPTSTRSDIPERRQHPVIALKIRPDLAIAVAPAGPPDGRFAGYDVVMRDPASGLTLVGMSHDPTAAAPVPWVSRRLQEPRYLVASDTSSERATLRPVFIGSLDPVESSDWPEQIWLVPTHTALTSGTFVFSSNGELVGVVVDHGDEAAIVPAETLLAEVERVFATRGRPAGHIGIGVQSLTPELAAATGAPEGVVVTWVDPDGASSGKVRVADIIERVDEQRIITPAYWNTRVARLIAGETMRLRLRRQGQVRDEQLTAAAATETETPINTSLGLTVRRVPRIGVEVVRVDRPSAAERAGLVPGDVITLIGERTAPTPVQLRSSFAAVPEGASIVVAFTRGDAHHVIALTR